MPNPGLSRTSTWSLWRTIFSTLHLWTSMTLMKREAFLNIFLNPILFGIYLFPQDAVCQGLVICVGGTDMTYTSKSQHCFSTTPVKFQKWLTCHWHMCYLYAEPQEESPHTQLYLHMGRNVFVLFFLNIYTFIQLLSVLLAAHGIFTTSCSIFYCGVPTL